VLRAVLDDVGHQGVTAAGRDRDDRAGDDLGERVGTQRRRQPGPGDDQWNGRERELQPEGPGVTEPVAVAEPQEAGREEVPEAVATDGVPRVVRGELVAGHALGLRDDADRAHARSV
jgi:hypothetical protein